MKVLITGGSGFIGQNLREKLGDKYLIQAPSSEELNLLDAVTVSDYLRRNAFDMIIHSATWNATRTSPKDTSLVLENNLRMFFNLARRKDDFGRMIYFGSGAEYSRENWFPRMKEQFFDTHMPTDQYGFSKYVMAKYSEGAGNIHNLRLFGIYGKYEDWRIRFISNACARAVHDFPITIRQNVYFDYLYIDDLVEIVRNFIDREIGATTFNVCTGITFDLITLAKLVIAVSGKDLAIEVAKAGLGREYSGDNSRLLTETGGFQFRNMESCIAELYNWYLTQKETIDREALLAER